MDGGDDFRSPQMREKVIKTLEAAIKDKQFPPTVRMPNDPVQLENAIFNGSQTKDDYLKKLNKVLQVANASQQHQRAQQAQHAGPHQGPPQGMGYEMGGMGQQRMGGQMIGQHMMDPMQQGTQQQQAPPNASITIGPLPPQQQHYQMGTGPMDGQGRLLPQPNPYGQQQPMGGGMGQQMGMQGQPQGNMVMNMQQGQPGQQQMMQQGPQHRMMTRPAAPGLRMGQPAQTMMMQDGQQRYVVPSQERPDQFMRMPQQQQPQTRIIRTTMSQQPHVWAGNSVMTVSSGQQPPPISDTVVVTHFGPGMPLRNIPNRDQVSQQNQSPMYSTSMQRPIMAQQQPQPNPQSMAGVQPPGRFEAPPRMPVSMQPQYPRHPGPGTAPSIPQAPVMGPPSAPSAGASGQYVAMQSPNTGPSPAPAPGHLVPDASPIYSSGPIGSVGPPRYNLPSDPSPANQSSIDVSVTEDPAYKEKILELHTYLDPLKRMLDQHQKDGVGNSPQSQKLLKIIDIIEGRSRATLELLLKCEETLKRMVQKEPVVKTKEAALCQPLFDVVASLATQPNANQTLKRVFGSVKSVDLSTAKRLCAPKHPNDPMPRSIEAAFAMKMAQLKAEMGQESTPKTTNAGSDSAKVPVSIQREVATLEPRFRIMFDMGLAGESGMLTKADTSRVIHVVCDLEDGRLPHVPALKLQIPNDYPVSSPKYDYELVDYCGSPFLDSLREMLIARLTNLGSNCSITSLLDSWESTVRQVRMSH